MKKVNAYAAQEAGGKLDKFQYELPELGNEQVDIKVALLWNLSFRFKHDKQRMGNDSISFCSRSRNSR